MSARDVNFFSQQNVNKRQKKMVRACVKGTFKY